MRTLFLIPARGGSKGIPDKNIKPLNGKPLIYYTLDVAKAVADQDDVICVSTDDDVIANAVNAYGFNIDFKRPDALATDQAGSYEVILHALEFYENSGYKFDKVVVLQPTSPFRKLEHVTEALHLFSAETEMVVSVKEARSNPYYTLVEENEYGYLQKSKPAEFIRRQDCPAVYEYNGAVYVMNIEALKSKPPHLFTRVMKYVMAEEYSLDLDTPLDWEIAEFILKRVEKI